MSARFADRVFIISGAGSHTGRATAKRLAAEGARLVLVVGNRDRDALSRPAATHNGTAALVTGDSAARATARDAVRTALTRFGRLDGVVTHDQATPEPATSAEALGLLDRMVHDSVRSTYLLAQGRGHHGREEPRRRAGGPGPLAHATLLIRPSRRLLRNGLTRHRRRNDCCVQRGNLCA